MRQLSIFKSLWGVVKQDGGHKALADVLQPLTAQGYSGVECSVRLAHDLNADGEFVALMKQHKLAWIPIIFSSGPIDGWDPFLIRSVGLLSCSPGDPVRYHVGALARQVEAAHALDLPIPFFNAHTGHDSFSMDKALSMFKEAAKLDLGGVDLIHEIHRGRCAHSPWLLQQMAPRLKDLDVKLVADYSHLTCVAEVAPGQCPVFEEAIAALTPLVRHVHARVGYENGPQVSDPRAPEWAEHVAGFERWWDAIWADQAKRGLVSTMTPEHGPATYQPALPFIREPLADIDEVNTWLAERQLKRFPVAS